MVYSGGQRALTFGDSGDLAHRYAYGPAADVLFDQTFLATGVQFEMRLPIVDHANSVRAAVDEALTLEQVIDYAPFGAVSKIRDGAGNEITNSSGKPNLLALDTVFTHHGSEFDAHARLQLKGRRWYDPDSGNFLSEDPIAADVNTYRFAGNDPTNYGDPTGLSQAGHPLGGGFSGGGLFQTPILGGNINNIVNSAIATPSFAAPTTFGGRSNLSSGFGFDPGLGAPLVNTSFNTGPSRSLSLKNEHAIPSTTNLASRCAALFLEN